METRQKGLGMVEIKAEKVNKRTLGMSCNGTQTKESLYNKIIIL